MLMYIHSTLKLKPLIILLIVIGSSYSLKAQSLPTTDFVKTQLPKRNTSEWNKILYGNDFRVIVKGGKLKITKALKKKEDREPIELVIDSGKFIGTDSSEFGGDLSFTDNSDNEQIIKKGNIRFLFSFRHQLFFIESSANLNVNHATLYEIIKSDNEYSYLKVLDFDDSPELMYILGNDILFSSVDKIYWVHNLKIETTILNDILDDLSVNSIAATDSRNVYLGARGGYLKFDLVTKACLFYKFKGL